VIVVIQVSFTWYMSLAYFPTPSPFSARHILVIAELLCGRRPQERSTILIEIIYIHATQFWWSRRHVTIRRTLCHTSCKTFEVSEYSRVYILLKNGGLALELTPPSKPSFLKALSKKDVLSWIFYHNCDVFLEMTALQTLLQNGYWLLNTPTHSIFMKVTWHAKNKDILVIALYEKTSRIALKLDGTYRSTWRAWREEILVQGHTFFFREDLVSDHLQMTTRAVIGFRLDFQVLLSSLKRFSIFHVWLWICAVRIV